MARSSTNPPRAWQRMLSGRRLDLLNPSPLDIEIEDIAHGLARVARWNGQTSGDNAFSVAQHCVVVEEICVHLNPKLRADQRLMALLHDGPEYVIGDMISPFKAVLGDGYRSVEERLEVAIHQRFGLKSKTPATLKKLIKQADLICAWFEATQIAGFSEAESSSFFIKPPSDLRITLEPMAPIAAQEFYLDRFNTLLRAFDRSETAGV